MSGAVCASANAEGCGIERQEFKARARREAGSNRGRREGLLGLADDIPGRQI